MRMERADYRGLIAKLAGRGETSFGQLSGAGSFDLQEIFPYLRRPRSQLLLRS